MIMYKNLNEYNSCDLSLSTKIHPMYFISTFSEHRSYIKIIQTIDICSSQFLPLSGHFPVTSLFWLGAWSRKIVQHKVKLLLSSSIVLSLNMLFDLLFFRRNLCQSFVCFAGSIIKQMIWLEPRKSQQDHLLRILFILFIKRIGSDPDIVINTLFL